tara:strand:+ start:490 stop:798 length:309 start_codon:yes stop_codon:yes gene_type:complete
LFKFKIPYKGIRKKLKDNKILPLTFRPGSSKNTIKKLKTYLYPELPKRFIKSKTGNIWIIRFKLVFSNLEYLKLILFLKYKKLNPKNTRQIIKKYLFCRGDS